MPNVEDAAPDLHPQDAMRVAADNHYALLENDKVRVLDTRLGPGERTPVHTHQWPSALYVMSWSDFVRYDPAGNVLADSRTMATKPAPGTSIWLAPLAPHCVHNVGSNVLHIIAVELKSS